MTASGDGGAPARGPGRLLPVGLLVLLGIVLIVVAGALALRSGSSPTAPKPDVAGSTVSDLARRYGRAGFRIEGMDGIDRAGDPTGAPVGCLLTADTPDQRATGLMGVSDLGPFAGMVFRYDADSTGAFYMKDTPMPLSIAWFGADGSFVSATDMEPCLGSPSCPVYGSTGPYRMALEVPRGNLDALGIGPGSRLVLTPTCA